MAAPRTLQELETPAAVVDLDVLERNCARMSDRMRGLGARLRPHVKTHKCAEIARLQTEGGPAAITVSTLAEARAFAAAGFRDQTWAVPLSLPRIGEALELVAELDRFQVLVDHETTRDVLERTATRRLLRVPTYLKVDCGYHRAGVDPDDPASIDLARRIADSPHLEFAGILTHGGHAYAARNRDEIARVACAERDVTTGFARRLRDAGIDVPTVSVGSTPTMTCVDHLDGVDEARPGNYAFFDVFQATIGSCTLDDVAFSVLSSVVGRYPGRDTFVLDAGGIALSLDPGPRHVDPDCGHGLVRDADGSGSPDGLRITALSQEHGKVEAPGLGDALPAVGSRVRVLPNHSCMAAAAFDRYHVVRGEKIVDVWRPAKFWDPETAA